MEVDVIPSIKLFKKCSIVANNPVQKELFLVLKKMVLYCINIKNKSIKKINTPVSMYDADVMFSSNGLFFIIIDFKKKIFVFNTKTFELINSFELSSSIYSESSITNLEIEFSEINECILYNEFLVCRVDYMRHAYLKHEYGPLHLHTGTEVYNIITSELITYNIHLVINGLHINNNIQCYIEDKPNEIYQITPQLDITKLSYNEDYIKQSKSIYSFEKDFISFSFFMDKNYEYKLYSTIAGVDTIIKTPINLNFKLNFSFGLFNVVHIPNYNCFMVGMTSNYDCIRILVFNRTFTKCLFYFDIKFYTKFYISDNYKIVQSYKSNVIVTETPFTKLLYLTEILEQYNKYYLPSELIDRLIYFF